MHPAVEETGDGPAEGKIVKLAEGQEVTEEPLRLRAILERQDGVEEGERVVGAPGVIGHHAGSLAVSGLMSW